MASKNDTETISNASPHTIKKFGQIELISIVRVLLFRLHV